MYKKSFGNTSDTSLNHSSNNYNHIFSLGRRSLDRKNKKRMNASLNSNNLFEKKENKKRTISSSNKYRHITLYSSNNTLNELNIVEKAMKNKKIDKLKMNLEHSNM